MKPLAYYFYTKMKISLELYICISVPLSNINDFIIYSSPISKSTKIILMCFKSLKFENSLFSNKFSNYIFRSKRIVYTTKKVQIKYFVKNWSDRRTFICLQTVAWLCCHCHKLQLFRFMEYTIQATSGSWNVLNHKWPPH